VKFENKIEIGKGIYTLPDLSRILNLEYYKVRRLLNEYWDKRLNNEFVENYSWTVNDTKAVSFHTLIEFYIFYQLKEVGVTTRSILQAHIELAQLFQTPFPFATSDILDKINCFGKKIVFEINNDDIIDLDSTKQFNLKFIKKFMHKIDFDSNNLAQRLYPMGKSNTVIVDPKHQFGQPTLKGTNILPETIYYLINRKESKKFISLSYDISLKQINDAIEYCKAVA